MNWDYWMIDASMSDTRRGRCLCPVELDKRGEVENIVIGMNYIGDKPPRGEIIGIFQFKMILVVMLPNVEVMMILD